MVRQCGRVEVEAREAYAERERERETTMAKQNKKRCKQALPLFLCPVTMGVHVHRVQ